METVSTIGRLLISLAAVLGLMWVIARKAGKRTGAGKSTRVVEVLGRQQLTRSASVAVVRILDQALIVGITDGQVNLVGETELDRVQAVLAAGGTPGKKTKLRTTRVPIELGRSTAPAAAPAAVAVADRPDGRPTVNRRTPDPAAGKGGALAGSALSPATWKQTVEALRDMTV
ncbi:MAG: FliO/MopB family protein, partial [Jatrophihabitans sp.]|uniref:FliO/MopB family protein n=1 Tax=Jatrophihabitans sp. TaxID=1932789 RepID=UPI003F7E435D